MPFFFFKAPLYRLHHFKDWLGHEAHKRWYINIYTVSVLRWWGITSFLLLPCLSLLCLILWLGCKLFTAEATSHLSLNVTISDESELPISVLWEIECERSSWKKMQLARLPVLQPLRPLLHLPSFSKISTNPQFKIFSTTTGPSPDCSSEAWPRHKISLVWMTKRDQPLSPQQCCY